MATYSKKTRRIRIKKRIRKKIKGTTERPRLSVFRSNTAIYVQIIDDIQGRTLASASLGKEIKNDMEGAKSVGLKIAELAKDKGIETVIFDRGGYLYHGKIKSLAEGAREGGLKF